MTLELIPRECFCVSSCCRGWYENYKTQSVLGTFCQCKPPGYFGCGIFAYNWKLPAYSGAFYSQLAILAFSLTIGAFWLTILASLLTIEAFLLSGKVRLSKGLKGQ